MRGPSNRRQGRPNQDAWIRVEGAFGHLIGVCDGMGSRPASDIGARAACRALRQAIRCWPGITSCADPRFFVRLVEIIWRLELAPYPPAQCATTCLFVLREPDGHLLLGGLGDGMILVREGDGSIATLGEHGLDNFGNETLALGVPHRMDDWWIETKPPGLGRMVVLATDGIADDLDPSKLHLFTDWLARDIGCLSPKLRWRRLCRELRNWPVPHHVDDKTVAVLAEMAEETG